MSRYLIVIALCLQLYAVKAQTTQGGQMFTLDRCVSYALENSIAIKNAEIDEKISNAKVKETRGIGLPQVDASVALRYNQKLPRFFVEKSAASPFGAGLPGDDGDVYAMQNIFQLKGSGDAGVTINQLIFNSSYLVGLQAANAYRELSVKTTLQTKEQVIQNVSKAYYLCLINKDRVNLYDNNISRVDTLLRDTKALFDNGMAEGIDVDRIQVSLNNLIIDRNKFVKLQELAVEMLKFQMNYPLDQTLEIAGDIAAVQLDENVLNNYELNWDYTQRSDYKVLESNRKLQSLNIKNKYAESLPSLSAFANLGYTTQSQTVSGLFKTNTNFTDTGELGPDKWYPYTAFGVSLNVPIFSGLQRSYKIQQEKLSLMKIENDFKSLKSGIDLEIKQTAANYLNAVESMEGQKQNQQLAENVARITKIKYEQGVGSNLEVVQAETDLREAQINYYNALYEALVAKIDLDKAYGKLIHPSTEK